ncbi:TonB-dependent siderophore receptor [Janthinobacterium psychrotolerans]|uniref:Outer-membrane receptor for ferric coprogen and ferric-rhodotorulic acid n=1 Tax=Janthinobacterium psychrotolerans TaxID=1747903 RepID=A0A1A7BTA1_9BURK|nr:TonB-dependent siderophore receptor [Janthinobacterium psychrotolerans]OBV36737.1 outer-membrane receptor for ferric coprogen and ferric-rhodotorulic acid [Janthinobacterium psychrotolerans]
MSRQRATARPLFVLHRLRHAARITLLCASTLILPMASAQADTAETDATMPAITITGTADKGTSTENSRSLASGKSSLFKGFESNREIPQPVTVITRQLLDDRAFFDMNEVLQNTPGVTVDYVDSERVQYFSRGYSIDAMQVDGLTITQGGSIFIQPDTAVLDHVEVLRGASGMLRGSGSPSATVNMVRKRPTRTFQANLGLSLGSWDRRRLEADVSGPLNDDGSVRGRLVAVKDKKTFFQDAKDENRKVLYGVLAIDLSKNTTLTTSLQHTDLDATGAWGGLPGNFDGSSLNLPRNTYLGADWNRWNRYNQQAFVELEHRFANEWTVKLSSEYTRMRMDDNGFKQSYFTRSSTTNPYLFGVTTSLYTGDAGDQEATGLTASGPFTLFGRKHQLVFGGESLRTKARATAGKFNLNPLTNVDIRNWNPYTSYADQDVTATNTLLPTYTRQRGLFGTARLSITDPLAVILGARASWWDYKAPATPASNYEIKHEITPFAGITYDITPQVNAYLSYTEIFTPQNVKDVNNNLLKPITGEDYEAGLKGEFFGGKLTASAGIFHINNEGRAVDDIGSKNPCGPSNPTGYCRIADGKTQSEGWELEVAGEILPGWQLTGGYTNTRTKYLVDATRANVGQPLRSIDPRQQLRLFTSYRASGALQGLSFGGGVAVQDDSYVRSGALTARQGGYAIFNAMAGYELSNGYSVQVNVNNLTDKVYYKKYGATGLSYYYGDPRNVVVSLRAQF